MEKYFGIAVLILALAGLLLVSSFGGFEVSPVASEPHEQTPAPAFGVSEPPPPPSKLPQAPPPPTTPPPYYQEPAPISQPEQSKVVFGYANVSGYTDITTSIITLYAQLNEGETVDITGWRIKGNRSDLIIPQAVSIYHPSGLTAPGNLILGPGDQVEIYSTISPIGRNFRINKCMGYLQETHNFDPPIYSNCPYTDRSEISHLSGTCQNYIISLGACRVAESNAFIAEASEEIACRRYLNTLNYRGCFDRHQLNYDFLEKKWLIWVGRQILDPFHDSLKLLDKTGKVVAEYSY